MAFLHTRAPAPTSCHPHQGSFVSAQPVSTPRTLCHFDPEPNQGGEDTHEDLVPRGSRALGAIGGKQPLCPAVSLTPGA